MSITCWCDTDRERLSEQGMLNKSRLVTIYFWLALFDICDHTVTGRLHITSSSRSAEKHINLFVYLHFIELWSRMHNRGGIKRAFSRWSTSFLLAAYLHIVYLCKAHVSTFDKVQTEPPGISTARTYARMHAHACIFMQSARPRVINCKSNVRQAYTHHAWGSTGCPTSQSFTRDIHLIV